MICFVQNDVCCTFWAGEACIRLRQKMRARAIHIVKYREEQLDEIKRVIEYAELDVKQLSMQKLSDAVTRSFTTGEDDPVPAKNDRYFSEASP